MSESDFLSSNERLYQYTCERHVEEVKKGGACCWCELERLRDENEALRHSILHPVAVAVHADETTAGRWRCSKCDRMNQAYTDPCPECGQRRAENETTSQQKVTK